MDATDKQELKQSKEQMMESKVDAVLGIMSTLKEKFEELKKQKMPSAVSERFNDCVAKYNLALVDMKQEIVEACKENNFLPSFAKTSAALVELENEADNFANFLKDYEARAKEDNTPWYEKYWNILVDTVWEWMKKAANLFLDVWNPIKNVMASIVDLAKDFTESKLDSLKSAAESLPGPLKDLLLRFIELLRQFCVEANGMIDTAQGDLVTSADYVPSFRKMITKINTYRMEF